MKKITFLFSIMVSMLFFVSHASALVMYDYTGENFTTFVPSSGGSYDTTMSVTGSISLASALPNNMALSDIEASILDYSFFDGVFTYTPVNTFMYRLRASTDSAGMINDWAMQINEPYSNPGFVGELIYTMVVDAGTGDIGGVSRCLEVAPLAGVEQCSVNTSEEVWRVHEIGSWGAAGRAVPEPSTMLLLGSGLFGLGYFRKKFKK